MTKIRKLKRAKKYQYNVNRKRMNKKRLPALESSAVKNAWNRHMSSEKNFKKMGLVFDVNKDIKALNREALSEAKVTEEQLRTSTSVVKELESDAKAAKSEPAFRFSKDQVDYFTYLLDKYGNDFKAMSRDKRNYLQQTPKQIRQKITLFKRIPAHYNEYLNRNNGLSYLSKPIKKSAAEYLNPELKKNFLLLWIEKNVRSAFGNFTLKGLLTLGNVTYTK